jgi:hypothetical protein
MSCALTTGYSIGCKGAGGLRSAWIIPTANITNIVEEDGIAVSIDVNAPWLNFQLQRNTASYSEQMSRDEQTGLLVYNQSFDLVINSTSASIRQSLRRVMNRVISVVIKDNNGNYWLIGAYSGIIASTHDIGSGKTISDRHGHTIQFTGQETEMALQLSEGAAASIDIEGSGVCLVVDGDGNYIVDALGDYLGFLCEGNADFVTSDFEISDFNI